MTPTDPAAFRSLAGPPRPTPPRLRRPRRERELAWLEDRHARFHRPELVAPDPLEFVREPGAAHDATGVTTADREVAALVAASLAYGNVIAMRPAIDAVLRRIRADAGSPDDPPSPPAIGRGPWPTPPLAGLAAALDGRSDHDLAERFAGFRYRVTPGAAIAGLLAAVRRVRGVHGDLESAFVRADRGADPTILTALDGLVGELAAASPAPLDHLLPRPSRGSACKRPCLMLRWLVREDEIDPGGWTRVDPARLVMPLDTHVAQAARDRRWTRRRTAALATALEITALLAALRPDDPLRWDFAITRPGIRGPAADSG